MKIFCPVFFALTLLFGVSGFADAQTDSTEAQTAQKFKALKNNPKALYTFLKNMPKGGELHYHLAGGPSAEIMLDLASKGPYCINTETLAVSKSPPCIGLPIERLNQQKALYRSLIDSWSMRHFTAGKESGQDHFFASFDKFLPIIFDYRSDLIAEVMQRAAGQKELYLELMDIPDSAYSSSFGHLLAKAKTPEQKRQLLLKNTKFIGNIKHTIKEAEHSLLQARNSLGCSNNPQQPVCGIRVGFLYYVLREQSQDDFFAQALTAFEVASRAPNLLLGVNAVQAENGPIALKDYHQQMQIFNYLHSIYPKVPIALHAGELTPTGAPESELGYHISDALFTGQAQRIGHGVDIMHEDNALQTLEYMAKHHIPVEINLSSNLKILNIAGEDHPLSQYLAHQVPIVLSTDDEGILRTNLTTEYMKAALEYHLDYLNLKQISRNALTYAFWPGASIWADAPKAELVAPCKEINAPRCVAYIKASPKAQLQCRLEEAFREFELKSTKM